MTNPNDPAFPVNPTDSAGSIAEYTPGLTKREAFIKAAMQGYCSNPLLERETEIDIAFLAVRQADATIAEMNK